MIKKLTLHNHESHKKTELKFNPGLNVFIGATDAGKSSVFRAAYWAIFNRPLGDSMRPLFWDGETVVEIEFDDCIVKRIKGKSTNHYQLNDNEPINAGNGPPPEIIENAINMDSVNFQTQVDRAFLMFESSGERGRVLNKIAGLDAIDKIMSIAKSEENRINREYSAKKSLIEELEADLKQFDDIEEREQKLLVCEQLDLHIKKEFEKIRKTNSIIDDLCNIDLKAKRLESFVESKHDLEQAKSLHISISELSNTNSRINKIIDKIGWINDDLKFVDDLPIIKKLIKEAKLIQERIDELNHYEKITKQRISNLNKKQDNIDNCKYEIKNINKQIKELRSKIKICSECGQEIK